ncbi:MAG: 5-aminolevulic acid synthase [Paracoccaceae bacterium]
MKRAIATALLALTAGGQTMAAPMTGETAKQQLFGTKGAEIVVATHDFLTDADKATLRQLANAIQYYGAIAAAPDAGLMADATMVAANHHGAKAARAEALAGCEAKRGGAGSKCVIVADVRPQGWSERALMLSLDATTGFMADYRKANAPKALAISPSTGQWAISIGGDAAAMAVAACGKKSGAGDCAVVVSD